MTTEDLRVASWNVRSTIGSTRTLTATAVVAGTSDPFDLTGLTVTLGGELLAVDVDDNVATITLVTPDALEVLPLVMAIAGEELARGSLYPSERGTDSMDLALSLSIAPISMSLQVVSPGGGVPAYVGVGERDGSGPDSHTANILFRTFDDEFSSISEQSIGTSGGAEWAARVVSRNDSGYDDDGLGMSASLFAEAYWNDSASLLLGVGDPAGPAIRMERNQGDATRLGFFGAASVVRPVVDITDLAQVAAALVALGLIEVAP